MGNKLRECRERTKMTQEELAAKSGISRGTICVLENGIERNTTSKTLQKLANALGVTVEQIFLQIAFN